MLCKNAPNGPRGPKSSNKADQILLAIQTHRDGQQRPACRIIRTLTRHWVARLLSQFLIYYSVADNFHPVVPVGKYIFYVTNYGQPCVTLKILLLISRRRVTHDTYKTILISKIPQKLQNSTCTVSLHNPIDSPSKVGILLDEPCQLVALTKV